MDLSGKRILIIKQSSLGDIVHTLPLVHALKRCYPTCRIGWVAEQGYASLIDQDAAVETVHPIHSPSTSEPNAGWLAYLRAFAATVQVLLSLRRTFRASPYDLVFDLHASFRSGLLSLTNPGGMRTGFADAKELNTLFQHHLIDNPAKKVHAVDKNLLFCIDMGCAPCAQDFYLTIAPEDQARVRRYLVDQGVGEKGRYVYVNPAARWQSKFWLSSRWAELCDRLWDAGILPVFGGSAGDTAYIAEITDQMTGRRAVAAGRMNLTESAALIKGALVYAGLDTGPMHMASLCGTPVVALFGPTHPERVGPYGVRNAVLQAQDVDCLCCRKRQCDHLRCMEGISVATVYEQVMAFIGDSQG